MTFEFSGRNVSTDQKQAGELKALHAELTRLDSGADATAGLDMATADQALKPVNVEFLKVSSGVTDLAPMERQSRNDPASLTTLLRDGWVGQDQAAQMVSGLPGVNLTSPVRCTCPQCNLPPVDPRRIISSPQLLNAGPLAAIDLNQTFLLNSLPGANHTIYLDFNGHTTTGTAWNNSYGSTIVTPAFDIDGNAAAFSNAELERIQYIWQRVVEDFSPFNVNVTTQEPTLDRLIKSGSTDTAWGVRVAIGGSSYDWFGQGAGGVAYVNSFNWDTDTPTYVFTAQLGTGNEKYTAEAISHEVGHTLGLYHDGRTSPSEGYYGGHGSGETGWAPIMGVGYYQNLVQWSKGEYLAANNTQDDLAIITGQNGFGYKADDTGSTLGTARALIVSGTTVSANGIIERNTDVDFFSFTTGAGAISLAVTPSGRSPNLDILAELYDATGTLVATANPADLLAASLNATVSAGTYYLKVDGTGKGDPLGTGYSDYGSLGQYAITGTIISGTAPPTLAIAATNATQTEGNSGTKAFTFTVTRAGNTSGANAVNWAVTGNGTNAANATDFANNTLPSGTVSFAPGETSKVITVEVQGDTTVEQNETFAVTLSNPTNGATLTTASATGTITNDDLPPVITLALSPISVQEDGTTNLVYTFTRSDANLSSPLTVNFGVSGTANAAAVGSDPADYTVLTNSSVTFNPTTKLGTVTFAANATTATVVVDPIADTIAEIQNETVAFTLNSGTGYTGGTPAAATGTIISEETLPIFTNPNAITIPSSGSGNPYPSTINASGLTGGVTSLKVTLTGLSHTWPDDIDVLLVGPTGAKVLLMSDVGGSNALNNVNLVFDPSATAFLPDASQITGGSYKPTDFETGDVFNSPAPVGPYGVDFSVFNNTNPNGTWSLYVMDDIGGDTGTIAGGWSLLIGTNNTPAASLAIAATNATQTEGNTGSKAFTFTVTRSGNTSGANTANWAVTGNGTNPANATDFANNTLPSGTVSFAAGETSKVITVTVQGDTTVEQNETFAVTLSNPTNGATLTTASATGTITNDDTAPATSLAIAATNATQTEGNTGSKAFTFTVTRSGNTSGANTANWAVTGNGTNPANATDFANNTLPSGTVSFAAGETSKVITVNVQGDTTVEQNETFAVTLSNPTNGATLTTASATGTITNDDTAPATSLAIAATDASAGETANPGAFTLTRTGATDSALTVNLAMGGTATNGTDYTTIPATVTFAAGSATAAVTLTPVDDLGVEGNETAILTLLSGSGYTLGSATSATVTLADNDVNGSNGGNTLTGDGGNNALNGLGGNDVLNGVAGSDRLNGGVGKDTLTGGSEIDQFVLGALGDSLLAGFDVITDYALGEQIDAPLAIAATTLTASSGNATSLTATAIQAVLTSGVFTANSARAFTVTGQTGTFLALNNGTAGFSAATDGIIHLSSYAISATNTVTIV
jgi:hypothetical protein